ncbi:MULTISPECIES: hypothetical protein [unclassified Methylophaga]|uniref:hypothetical protein n=3 Tax=Methylophaga TaxID=40222 RepID=UPI0025E9E2A7|nr:MULTISPECIES: hypothetical protein [unclassified Methylophaga]
MNNLRLTPQAKIGLPQMDLEGVRGMELWTHVLEEMVLRHGPYPNGFTRDILHSEPFPDFVGDLGKKSSQVLSSRGLKEGQVFIKFGEAKHMTSLYERGELRVQAASYYATPDHNGAVRDDELFLPLSLSLTRDDVLKFVLNPQDVPEDLKDHRLDINYDAGTDYWLYCLTTTVEPRLFVDFQADACVIIHDKNRFRELLIQQSTAGFSDATFQEGNAVYVDPLLPKAAAIDVPMSKHFRYEYQKEYRFIWKPRKLASGLPYIDIAVGSLESIAELVVL